MKYFFSILLLGSIALANAFEIKVHSMKRTSGYTERFDLGTDFNYKMVLDCQSFIQGLLFGPYGEEALMLQEWECDELMTDMKESHNLRRSHCLEVNMERGILDSHNKCSER